MSANNLLEPGNHALLLIDHQYLQLLTLHSHEASQSRRDKKAAKHPFRKLQCQSAANLGSDSILMNLRASAFVRRI